MPLFEYRCTQCGQQFEELVLGTTTPTCPVCHSQQLDKLLSTFAVGSSHTTQPAPVTPCSTCGDPRGPGACALD